RLEAAFRDHATPATRGLFLLRDVVRDVAGVKGDDPIPALTRAERELVAGRLTGRALTHEVMTSLHGGALRREERDRLLRMLDEARAASPKDAFIEWRRAQFLVSGSYFEEAREAIARITELTRDEENPYEKSIEELQQAI